MNLCTNMSFYAFYCYWYWILFLIDAGDLPQEWLDKRANYEAIVDGANVGYYQRNFSGGGFTIFQV